MEKICVLLCSFNGEKFIEEQIYSILKQKNTDVHLYISDDNSSDKTHAILIKLKKKFPKIIKKIYQVKKGSAIKNFSFLINKINLNYEYYAFSDQDDIWKQNKLKKAVNILKKNYDLYCGRTNLVSINNKKIGYSPLFEKNIVSFNHSFVQSIAGGNTMVFNKKIIKYLKISIHENIPSHDWWTYLVTTFAGGNVFYDSTSYVYYRQHENNLIGHNTGLKNKFIRLYNSFFKNVFLKWNKTHLNTLIKIRHLGTKKNNNLLNELIVLNKKNLIERISFVLIKKKIFRQSLIGTIVLLFLVIFKKF